MRTFLKRGLGVLAVVVAVLLVPAAGATVSALSAFGALYAPGPERGVPAAAPLPHDPSKPTAVVVVGDHGAVVSDVLAPYEVLAATGRFNLYTVASQRRPLTLTGGLDLVPDLTFAELAARTPAADLVVVPALPDVGEPSTAPVTEWLRTQAAGGAQLLSVCNGSGVLASAGLLDGRPATSHWLRIGEFESDYPAVNWVRGQRFVDDGDIVSTAGILSGVDGTLHVIGRLVGPEAARAAAAAVGWGYADPPVTPEAGMPDPVAIINAGFTWNPPEIGVLLTDGTGEIELASVFDVHGGQSLAARTLALTEDGGPIRSRHGLTFLPRDDLTAAAPRLDRLLVPGAAAQDVPVADGPAPEYVHRQPGFAYEATVRDLAGTTDVATARWTAKVLELPADGLVLDGPAWPWTLTLLPVLLVALGGAAVWGIRKWFVQKRH
ncbi:DJ-1/PfpI family protein [Amycolatopsis sp. 195334CR]|uniref:DJ-1/PfpI family protein n=1 Tax=Amycolatopsis sp. 195334CR TaxID=2814588 RepID=UPI001A8F1C04|nr:DJ-1/PfpI family protein [Amycolatopsis sp. 195334CR]MBN6041241.1 DJ-1/PfpI family protein [Amycolatopsis sp. 195334CR]